MTDNKEFITTLKSIVGDKYILTSARSTERFRKGFRSGEGDALAVVRPATLLEQWQVLKACVAANKIVIMQAANTGLTEGSTPNGQYDREVVLINTNRMKQIQLLNDGQQIISFPGATLFSLEDLLAPLKRRPHSVIGSSCIGASIVGGVCNNAGGSLIERGPSYTELSLHAQINAKGELVLVNHLGIYLGETPEEILTRLENGNYTEEDIQDTDRKASDTEYAARVRNIESDIPSRFNADKRLLYEAAGCAGKLAIFAVRLDTYPCNDTEQVFYIGTNNADDLTKLRRHILSEFKTLPVSAEYIHREAFNIAETYGKDTLLTIDKLGTKTLPTMFAMKGLVDAHLNKLAFLPKKLIDRLLQFVSRIWPDVLPEKMLEWRDKYEHHLILKVHNGGIKEAENYLQEFFSGSQGGYFPCTEREATVAGLHRFATAGAAIRYQAVHHKTVEDILALDIALPRNTQNWLEELPPEISDKIIHKIYYGHFMCHVFHQDYIVKKGVDVQKLKAEMLAILDKRGAEYPAEHNVGHLYKAKPDLANFYKKIDPTNSLNPGIGKLSKARNYL
jgi:D-lactate dehydrogenase